MRDRFRWLGMAGLMSLTLAGSPASTAEVAGTSATTTEIAAMVQRFYAVRVPENLLVGGDSIDLLSRLDPHSRYFPPGRSFTADASGRDDDVDRPNLVSADPAAVVQDLGHGLALVRLASFHPGAPKQLRAAISHFRRQGAGLNGLVLDLRNHSGGDLVSTLEIADIFLAGGDICQVKDEADQETFRARPGDDLRGAPMVVLINGATSSGAEIVAAALQDNRRATVVGLPSAGLGLSQTMIPLERGTHGWLRLTTGWFLRATGEPIQGLGVTPDQLVARETREAESARAGSPKRSPGYALATLRPDLFPERPALQGGIETPPFDFEAGGDFQLHRALVQLTARALDGGPGKVR